MIGEKITLKDETPRYGWHYGAVAKMFLYEHTILQLWHDEPPPEDETHPDCLKCCGNCIAYQENEYGRLDCSNGQSDLFDDAVELNDICDEWKWRVRRDIEECGE